MIRFSIKPRRKNCVKGYRFLLVAINLSNKYEKKTTKYCYKSRIKCCTKYFQKVIHKIAEATKLIGNKIFMLMYNLPE